MMKTILNNATMVLVVGVPCAIVAIVAMSARTPQTTEPACEVIEGPAEAIGEWTDEAGACRGTDGEPCVAPLLAAPISIAGQHTVSCPQVDAGTSAELLRPDGGVLIPGVSTYYVSPVAGAGSTKLRLGGDGLTPTTGIQIGLAAAAAKDGTGFTMDAKNGRCVSEGNAVSVDVTYGRQ